MTFLTSVFKELIGLFVDDGSLALQLVVLIALIAVATKLVGLNPLLGAGLLLIGCVGVLVLSLRRMLDR